MDGPGAGRKGFRCLSMSRCRFPGQVVYAVASFKKLLDHRCVRVCICVLQAAECVICRHWFCVVTEIRSVSRASSNVKTWHHSKLSFKCLIE